MVGHGDDDLLIRKDLSGFYVDEPYRIDMRNVGEGGQHRYLIR